MIAATNAQAASDATASARASGSQNDTPYSCDGDEPSGADRQRQAERQSRRHARERRSEHERNHLRRGRRRAPSGCPSRPFAARPCRPSRRTARPPPAAAPRSRTAPRGSPPRAPGRTTAPPAAAASARVTIVRLGSTSASALVSIGSSAPGDAPVTSRIPPMKCDCSSIRAIESAAGTGRSARAARRTSAAPACSARTRRTSRRARRRRCVNVSTFSGRSRPKCCPSGSSSCLKNRFTNASLTIATSARGLVVGGAEMPSAHQRDAEVLQVVAR